MAERDLWDKFWKDKQGDVVVYQHPNFILITWVMIALVSLFVHQPLSDIVWNISLGVLAVWSILEMWKGVNYFRKSFGAVVLLLVILAAFRIAI